MRLRSPLRSAIAVAGLLAATATTARADEAPTRPDKRESDAYPPSSVRLPTFFGGLAFTAGWWGLNYATYSMFPDASGFRELRTPVIGPWQAIHANSCDADGCGFFHYFNYVYFGLSGLAQAGGLGIALESMLVPTSRGGAPAPRTPRPTPASPPPDGEPATTPPAEAPSKPLFYLPQPIIMGKSGWGVGLSGAFLRGRLPACAESLRSWASGANLRALA